MRQLEEQLGLALGRGDADAAATLVIEALGREVLGYLRVVVRDPEDAEDVFSTFAENVWKGLPTWRRECSVRTWAYRVAWNAASRLRRDPFRRRRTRWPEGSASLAARSVLAASRQSVERRAEALDALRARLSPEEQSLLTLRLDRRLSWREVAEVMAGAGQPADEAALRKRFERLKERLAGAARRQGLTRRS